MKTLGKILALAGALLMGSAPVAAYTAEDYCDIGKSTPKSVKTMCPLNDGATYSAISDDGKSIDAYSYKTGKRVSTLFSVDEIVGDVKISEFSGYTLSDNERYILLWNNKHGVYRYSFFADYYVYDIGRKTMKRVSDKGRQRGAVLSHDGRYVAYQRDNNIFISNLDYGTDQAITSDGEWNKVIYGTPDWAYEEEFGILNTMRWSADDNTLVFMRFDESEVPVYSFDNYRSFCDSDPLGDPYPQSYSYKYPLAGYPNSVVKVLAYNLSNRTTKEMDLPLAKDDYIPVMEFAAGSNDRLLCGILNRDQNNLRIYSVNPGSTVARLVYTDTSFAWLSPTTYQMGHYGADSFVIASERSGYRHLYRYDYSGNQLEQITDGNFNVTAYYGYDAKSRLHYVQTTSLGAINRNVASVAAGGKLTLLNPEPGFESASFSKNFTYFVRNYSNANTPTQYTVCDAKGKLVAELEMNRAYASRYSAVPKKEFLKVKNARGQEMDAYMIKPVDFNPSGVYPMVIWQYNGPESQEVKNRWTLDGLFYLAQEGYIVCCVDGRGTGNRERDWAVCVYKNLGQLETEDQLAAVEYFASLPYIDRSRMACWGWSYGGYMTLMEMSHPQSQFKCGVAMAPVTDWRWYDSIYTERFMLTPQQNAAGYDKGSAIARANDLKGRLLIMSGTSDDNVHFYNTLKYTSKLNYLGTVYDMLALTGWEHSLRMCNARTMLYSKVADFLNGQLK